MSKKNPNKFTIGFKNNNPAHQKAADILNHTNDKADLIANAVLHNLGEDSNCTITGISRESFQLLIREMVQQEIQKSVDNNTSLQKEEEPDVLDLSEDNKPPVDEQIVKNMLSAMDAFRKM